MNCNHESVTFIGKFSMVGNYHCDKCGLEIDPVEYAKMKGHLNIALLSYYKENPDKLLPQWRDHPWVREFYEPAQ